MKTEKLLLGLFMSLFVFAANGQVKYVHSTFGNNPKTDINISWVTADTTDTSTYVLYGTDTLYGSKSYNQRELVVLKEGTRNNLVHHITLTGLTPGTKYHYKCGGDNGLSGDCTFRTAPEGNPSFTFAAIGDPQIDPVGKPNSPVNMKDCANFLKEQDVSFVISLGDQVESNTLLQWDTLFESGKSMFENMVFLPILGSHDGGGGVGLPFYYKNLFRLPFNGSSAWYDDWYSFEYSNSIFANLYNYHALKCGNGTLSCRTAYPIQTAWMDSVYSNTTKTWKFASWHVPPVTSKGDSSYYLFDEFLAKMKFHKVTTVFSAHTHGYLFTHPIDSATTANPIIVNNAIVEGGGPFKKKATANRSQGTIYYTGAAVVGSSGTNGTPPSYIVSRDTSNWGGWLLLLGTVYNDSIVYKVVLYRNGYHYPPYGKGSAYFTYKIINDTPGKKFTLNASSTGNGTTNPTGAVQYNANDNASITAIPAGGYVFDNWTGADIPVGKENDNPLVIKMDTNKTIIAHFKTAPLYSLTVNSGTGSGNYAVGIQVPIAANAPATGKVFDKWTGDVASIANVSASSTTITMPSANAAVTATYKDAPPSFTLTVNEGTGSGSYTAGTVVTITANAAPMGQVFDKWTGDVTGITNVNTSTTSITMPSANAVITATFKDITNAIASEKSMVSIFPNPATDVINVLSSLSIEEVKVADLTGKILMIENLSGKNSITLSLKQLEKGMYIIDIKLSSGNAIQKTFIVR